MNFSRTSEPSLVRIGCRFGEGCLDATEAIRAGLLQFPRDVSMLEEVLEVEGGLEDLETQITALGSQSGAVGPHLFDESAVRLHAPVTRPQKLIGIGLNYFDHAQEAGIAVPKTPLLFGMYANAITGPDTPIVLPAVSEKVDYEAELAIVIGSRARNVPVENALRYVAGYTIVHDVSARDLQFSEKQWLRGKSVDTFAPMGPYLVTRAALNDADGLAIGLRLNGRTMQQSNTRNLIFKVPALVSHISQTMTLEPGDVIATGTPAGVGYVRNPPVFLKPGDVVEIEIEGIGILRNSVSGPSHPNNQL